MISLAQFEKKLVESGLAPAECTSFELLAKPGSRPVIKISCYATEEQLDKLIALLAESPEAARELAREITFRSYSGKEARVTL